MLLLVLQIAAAPPLPAQRATVTVAYAVNTEGRIEDCQIVASSGRPALDGAACRTLTEKGRFTPKRGPDGNPVRVDRREQRITFATDE